MKLRELFRIRASDNPDSLLRLLVVTASLSMAITIVVSSIGFYRVFSGFVIRHAESDSVSLCNMLIERHEAILFSRSADNHTVLEIGAAEYPIFDRDLRRILAPYQIIKVKIYDTGKKIIYSTEAPLIGKVDAHNLRLVNALAGMVDARMETKEDAHDLQEERLLDVDVVETYVPLVSPGGRVLGSFEIYMNVTPYRKQIRQGVLATTGLLGLALLAVFGVTYVLIRSGTSQLRDAQAQLEVLACTDTLTGIANRRYFLRWGEEAFAKVLRARDAAPPVDATLCALLIDVDLFKSINDTWGHLVGDQVLREVAERLDGSVRPYDITGRYGGEEFAVLLPDTGFETGQAIAERIRERMRGEYATEAGETIMLTVSIGLACTTAADARLTDLLRRADEGLYLAKSGGRDRIAWV